MVEWGGLENRCPACWTVGSNPTLSAVTPLSPKTFPQLKTGSSAWVRAGLNGIQSILMSYNNYRNAPHALQQGSNPLCRTGWL